MLARIRKATEEKDQGFTLIELLVVMIIIGILAAIAIPVFLSQREKARDSSTKADVSTAGKEMATFYVDGGATTAPPAVTIADGEILFAGTSIGPASEGTEVAATTGTNSETWCISFTNDGGATGAYQYSATGGLAAGDCTP